MKKDAIVFNYGGGRQTVAMCVMIAKGILPKPDVIVIADTGRENPSTWEYLETYMRPLMQQHGLDIHIAPHSLATVDLRSHQGTMLMPVYTQTGKFKAYCSGEWKKSVVDRYLKSIGIGGGTKWLGLAFDETRRWSRLHNRKDGKWLMRCPLVDFMLNTQACLEVIKAAGLPTPHHSSCWMCPHKRNAEWRHIRDNYPDQWRQAVQMDEDLRRADREEGVFLHHSRMPLAMANINEDESAAKAEQCSLGVCFV